MKGYDIQVTRSCRVYLLCNRVHGIPKQTMKYPFGYLLQLVLEIARKQRMSMVEWMLTFLIILALDKLTIMPLNHYEEKELKILLQESAYKRPNCLNSDISFFAGIFPVHLFIQHSCFTLTIQNITVADMLKRVIPPQGSKGQIRIAFLKR